MSELTVRFNEPVGDLYHAHQIAWKIMQKGSGGYQRDFLFRFRRFADGFAMFQFRKNESFDYVAGDVLTFSLDAAPSRRTTDGAGRMVARSLLDETSAMYWLHAQGIRHGFEIKTVQCRQDADSVNKHGARFCLVLWSFSGELVVTSSKLFNQAMATGIGRMKAFGQGMLVVKEGVSR